jgi:hypothetical protein
MLGVTVRLDAAHDRDSSEPMLRRWNFQKQAVADSTWQSQNTTVILPW